MSQPQQPLCRVIYQPTGGDFMLGGANNLIRIDYRIVGAAIGPRSEVDMVEIQSGSERLCAAVGAPWIGPLPGGIFGPAPEKKLTTTAGNGPALELLVYTSIPPSGLPPIHRVNATRNGLASNINGTGAQAVDGFIWTYGRKKIRVGYYHAGAGVVTVAVVFGWFRRQSSDLASAAQNILIVDTISLSPATMLTKEYDCDGVDLVYLDPSQALDPSRTLTGDKYYMEASD